MVRRIMPAVMPLLALSAAAMAVAHPTSRPPTPRPGRHVARVAAVEPGVPAVTFSDNELFTEIGAIYGEDAPDYHGTAFWYQGYLGIVFAKGVVDGGISLWDISDPRSPVLVGRGDHAAQREGHTTGFIETELGVLAVTPASNGINLWDLNDPTNPHVVQNVTLPGILPVDYDLGAWWTAVQSPYVYVGGSYNGLYVVDLSDVQHPRVVNRIRMDGGFRCGAVFAVGDLLMQSSSEGILTRLYDISDPVNPSLIKEFEQAYSAYATHFNGGWLYLASERGGVEIVDLTEPSSPATIAAVNLPSGGAYMVAQDQYIHLGDSELYYKVDTRDLENLTAVGSCGITTELPEVDVDFVSPLGNLVVLSDDHNLGQHNAGSRLVPHQAAPDTTPPEVNYVNPENGADGVATTSRIGITLTDQILVTTASVESFIVRPVGGSQAAGRYSVQHGIVNFAPDGGLEPNTEYEVIVPAGGLRDYAGNPISKEFYSTFTTGSRVVHPPRADAGADVTAWLGEPTSLDASGTRGGIGRLEYSWDPGDGAPATGFSTSPTLSYVYATPGHWTAIVTVRDKLGQTSSDEVRVTAVDRPLEIAPTHSSTIALDETNSLVWAVNPDSDTIAAIDATQLVLEREIPVGHHPTTLAVDGDHGVWVVDQESAELHRIDALDLVVTDVVSLPAGSRPYGVARDPQEPVMYVSLEGLGELLAFDSTSGAALWSADVGPTPRGIAVVGESIFVSRFISPEDRGEVTEVDRTTGTVLRTWTLAEDPGPDSDIGGRGIPNYLSQVVPTPDGGRLLVPSNKQNTHRGQYVSGQALTFESTNRAIVSFLDVNSGEEDLGARRDLDNRDHASALAASSLGDYGFVALQGSRNVIILDLLNGQEVGSIQHVGHAPQGLVLSPDGLLFIQNFMGRDVSVYDVSTFSDVDSIRRMAVIRTVGEELLSTEALVGKRIFYNSSDTRMSRDSYISCAGCHLDGGSDRRVWDFTDRGEGLRRTTTLRGRGGMRHGPVHWSANFDEIQDFENDMRNAFGGTGFMSDNEFSTGTRSSTLGDKKAGVSPELDALAAYVSSLTRADLSPYRTSSGALTDAAVRGRDLFRSAELGCAECHAGPHFTDSVLTSSSSDFVLHDVGTLTPASGNRLGQPLTGIDTPTLKGVWNDAPYLHDGSASSLRDVLVTRNPEDRHGRTSQLSEQQLEDLEAYLQQIDARSGAPDVVSMTPRDGLRLWAPKEVKVGFSAWVDPASVTSSSLTVLLNGAAVAGSLSVDRDVVTFTPASPLAQGEYTVQAGTGIRSIDGDAAVAWTGGFEVADVADLRLISSLQGWSSHADAYGVETNLRKGAKLYGDRDDVLLQLPDEYVGLTYVRTANEDRSESRPGLVTFDLAARARVYVAFDYRQAPLPGWAADFVPTGKSLLTSDGVAMPIFVGTFSAGRVLLGGPRTDGGANNDNMYFVFCEPAD